MINQLGRIDINERGCSSRGWILASAAFLRSSDIHGHFSFIEGGSSRGYPGPSTVMSSIGSRYLSFRVFWCCGGSVWAAMLGKLSCSALATGGAGDFCPSNVLQGCELPRIRFLPLPRVRPRPSLSCRTLHGLEASLCDFSKLDEDSSRGSSRTITSLSSCRSTSSCTENTNL